MQKFSDILLQGAHIVDAWRLIPRAIVGMYGFMIYKLFMWYTTIPTHEETSCDDALVRTLLENNIDVDRAMELACTVIDTVGGPTGSQTSFVTVIVGLSSAMFGFYVNSGGSWRSSTNFSPNSFTKHNERIPWRKGGDTGNNERDPRDERKNRPE